MIQDKNINIALCVARSFINDKIPSAEELSFNELVETSSLSKYLNAHKLIPLSHFVLKNIKNEIPHDFYTSITESTKRTSFRNLELYREGNIIVEQFKKAGITVVPYKGPHFTRLFYQELSLRSSIDVDLAIMFRDLARCKDIMSSLGYKEVKGSVNPGKVKKSRAYYLDYPWVKRNARRQNIIVEFHLSPVHKALYLPLDFDQVLEVVENRTNGNNFDFTLAEHAFFTVLHHGVVDLWGKLMHLVDLYQIWQILDPEGRGDLIGKCEQYGVMNFLSLGFHLIDTLFEVKTGPKDGPNISSSFVNKLACDIVHSRLNGKWSENRIKLKYYLALRTSNLDKMRSVASLLRYATFNYLNI